MAKNDKIEAPIDEPVIDVPAEKSPFNFASGEIVGVNEPKDTQAKIVDAKLVDDVPKYLITYGAFQWVDESEISKI